MQSLYSSTLHPPFANHSKFSNCKLQCGNGEHSRVVRRHCTRCGLQGDQPFTKADPLDLLADAHDADAPIRIDD